MIQRLYIFNLLGENRLIINNSMQNVLLNNLELELLKLDNKVRFILGVVRGEIIVNNIKRADLFLELHHKVPLIS